MLAAIDGGLRSLKEHGIIPLEDGGCPKKDSAMGYKVGLTDAAQSDLAAAVSFLAEKSPKAAARVGNELLDVALALSHMLQAASVRPSAPGRRDSPSD